MLSVIRILLTHGTYGLLGGGIPPAGVPGPPLASLMSASAELEEESDSLRGSEFEWCTPPGAPRLPGDVSVDWERPQLPDFVMPWK